MTADEMVYTVKDNLRLDTDDHDLKIVDMVLAVCDYCNLDPECIPDILEPVVRKKVKGILDYERANGEGYVKEVVSIKEGDGSITYATGAEYSREGIYSLSAADKAALRRHRRLRGYG